MKILVTDDFDDFLELESKVKEVDSSIEIVYAIKDEEVDEDKLKENIGDADVLIVGKFNEEILEMGKELKWIHSTSAGVNRLLFSKFVESKVKLSNASGIHPIPIAEHVFGSILCFQREFMNNIKAQLKREWRKTQMSIPELYEKTIGIVGVGEIGKRVAEIGKAFGCYIIGVKRTISEEIENVDELYSIENLDKLLEKSDYVVLCLPSTKKTENMFTLKEFKKMKKSAVIVNIGRGHVIKDEDLVKALKDGVIKGAALDVFRNEPLEKDSPYYELENVLITPHHSGSTRRYDERSIKIFCENLKEFLESGNLTTEVNKEEEY
jgi:phosphoglycerate dehydrogenase-like enzyme